MGESRTIESRYDELVPQNHFFQLDGAKNVNASEDTKCGLSVVAVTLQSLTDHAKLCHETIDLLEAGQQFNRAEVVANIGKLLDACQNLRDVILSEDSGAAWTTKQQLHALVQRLDDAAEKRARYLFLAQFLANGTVQHRRERTRQERLALRDAAVSELMEISALASPPVLPGPAVEEWLAWACSLEDEADEPDLQNLKTNFPRLDDFVRQLEIEWWRDGQESPAVQLGKSIPSISPAPTTASESPVVLPRIEETVLKEEPLPATTSPLATESNTKETPANHVDKVWEELNEASIFETPSPTAAAENAQVDEVALDSAGPSVNGRLSFFPWDQIEEFSRRIEKSKVGEKEARKVRALIAVSLWLEPREQNPVTHPKCGIRALTGFTGTSDLDPVAPGDVKRLVDADEGLLLFTGGADLLRWGLLQPSENHFQGIASLRRLTLEHLKAWFGELYKIALSDKQFEDIYNLTSGIPQLVREMHKLIIPIPDDPPTWLGLARWMEIKENFQKQLLPVAQDLKKGLPAARLTDRELALLKMVVIASDDSTPETIAANLSDNWHRYGHSELRALSSRDEASIALLQELGLLPMRHAAGIEPSKALLPLEPEDAVRQIVSFL